MKVYGIFDSKVKRFVGPPFLMETPEQALRGFVKEANNAQSDICAHPEDFSLHELGEFDEEKGSFENHAAPVNLGLAAQYKRSVVQDVQKH